MRKISIHYIVLTSKISPFENIFYEDIKNSLPLEETVDAIFFYKYKFNKRLSRKDIF